MTTVDTTNKRQRPGDDSPPKQIQKRTKGKTKINVEGTKCFICDNAIAIASETNEGEDALFCDGLCQAWCHRKCIGLSRQLFTIVCESDDPFLCLYCSLACYQKEIVNLSEQVKSLSSEIAQLKSQDSTSGTDKAESLHASVSNVVQSSNGHSHVPQSQDISKIVTSALSEEKEKEKRRLNLIIHNLKESQEVDPHKRKESDIKETKELCQKYLGVQVKISNAFRIGKKRENVDKPCLLKVTVNSSYEKAQVLRNCIKLHNKDNPEVVQSIYVSPDLTTKERDANKKLRDELKQRKDAGEKNLMIKRGKIITRPINAQQEGHASETSN